MRSLGNQRGETIVEVLIAIAVISSVLGTAYAIVSRNTQSYQQVNEHTEAQKVAEAQLERLRKADLNNAHITDADKDFCFDQSGAVQDNGCQFGVDNRYNVIVRRSGVDDKVFTSEVSWDGIHGGTDQVSLSYRVY